MNYVVTNRTAAPGELRSAVAPITGRAGDPRRWLTVALLLLTFIVKVAAAEDPVLEYRVKAGFLFNFAKFVEWPAGKLSTAEAPIVIGVLANDPAAPVLQETLQGKSANKHPLDVKILNDLSQIGACHIFFLGKTQKDRLNDVLAQAQRAPLLTLGESERFAEGGGMINLVRKQDSFRFEVNLAAAERAGLKISAKLAGMATLVNTEK
jgi:hypothetical protein